MVEARPTHFPPYIEDRMTEKFWVTWINGVAELGPKIRNIEIEIAFTTSYYLLNFGEKYIHF
jgi:hypothetical protein